MRTYYRKAIPSRIIYGTLQKFAHENADWTHRHARIAGSQIYIYLVYEYVCMYLSLHLEKKGMLKLSIKYLI